MKLYRLFALACAILVANSAFLFVIDGLPFPPRTLWEAAFYTANVLIHLAVGWAVALALIKIAPRLLEAARRAGAAPVALLTLTLLSLFVVIGSGLYLMILGNHHRDIAYLDLHIAGACGVALFGLGYLLWAATRHDSAAVRPFARLATGVFLLLVIGVAGGLAYIRWGTVQERGVSNPTVAPVAMIYEGGGRWKSPFWPSSAESVGNQFFPASYFMDSASCGKVGCHKEIYDQWNSSVHHLSSFNNQWYRKSVEYLQEVKGTRPSKWCGGCHDMSILLTRQSNKNASLMDIPIVRQDWPPEQFPKAHAGIGCAVCHTIVHVKSSMGNGDYLADYPPMHKFVDTKNVALREIYDYILKVAPRPHDRTFLKPFHREDVAEFCSVCHKVHLDVPVNSYRWFRGFNDYDAWQQSGVSGQGAQSFYYPSKPDGTPDFKTCADCHMPLVKSNDPAALKGMVHSHRFAAVNTALPFVNNDTVQLNAVETFMKDKQLSVDLFALRRSTAGASPESTATATGPRGEATPQAASLNESTEPTSLTPATGRLEESVVAPLDRGAVAVRRGETFDIDAVVRTRKVGHGFPGGTNDAFDVWLQLDAWDNLGHRIFSNGDLEYPNGPVDRWAHFYGAKLIDQHGNEINKRNASQARFRVYAHVIPPGADDTVHYEIRIPKDCGSKIHLVCKLNYRKFSWYFNQWSFAGRPITPGHPDYAKDGRLTDIGVGLKQSSRDSQGNPTFSKEETPGRPVTVDYDDRQWVFDASTSRVSGQLKSVPNLPIVTMASAWCDLQVVDGDPVKATAPRKLQPKVDMLRWNDYGIGLLLQGDSLRATNAFQNASRVMPKSPEPLVNLGRIRLLEGNMDEAKSYFEKALALYDAHSTPMTRYQRARTENFYAQALKNTGDFDKATALAQDVLLVFPRDRFVHNLLGRIDFLRHDFKDAEKEYLQTLAIDPEDITANYNLMLVYRGLGKLLASEERLRLYLRFKNDELNDRLGLSYKMSHPWDNNESQAVHTQTNHPYG